jgi:hypothetical protein
MESSSLLRSNRRPRLAARSAAIDLVALALAVVAVVGAARCAPRSRAAGLKLMLEVRTITGGAGQAGRSDAHPGGGLTLALNSMSDAERSRMAEVLGEAADRLERDHNPLVEELDDGDARSDFGRLAHERLPTITAAYALAPGRWQSADARLLVRATTACDPGARCLPLGVGGPAPSGDRVAARARFLAWPLAYAVVLRPPSDRAQAAVEALRKPADGSRIALVLGRDDLHALRFSDALPYLADSAARIARWAPEDAPMKELFRRLSARDVARDDAPWLDLPAGALLVVPRLGALATIAAFVQEVRTRVATVAPGPQIEWLALPPG